MPRKNLLTNSDARYLVNITFSPILRHQRSCSIPIFQLVLHHIVTASIFRSHDQDHGSLCRSHTFVPSSLADVAVSHPPRPPCPFLLPSHRTTTYLFFLPTHVSQRNSRVQVAISQVLTAR